MYNQKTHKRDVWSVTRWFFIIAGGGVGLLVYHPLPADRVVAIIAASLLLLFVPPSWYQKNLPTLLAETVLAVALALLVPGLGIFPLFLIASDIGSHDYSRRTRLSLAAVLGIAASWSLAQPDSTPSAWGQFVLLAVVFSPAMWANMRGVQDHRRLSQAYQELQQAQETVRELAGLQERERIAHELHDVLGHSLTLIILKAELMQERLRKQDLAGLAEDNQALLAVARQSLQDVRSVVEAQPTGLHGPGAVQSLRQELEEAGIEVQVSWTRDPSWPPDLESDILLIAQEAVTNILRHAKATRVSLSLSQSPDGWRLEICDNGSGQAGAEGLGILGIRRRANTWDATVHLEAHPGMGTQVLVQKGGKAHG